MQQLSLARLLRTTPPPLSLLFPVEEMIVTSKSSTLTMLPILLTIVNAQMNTSHNDKPLQQRYCQAITTVVLLYILSPLQFKSFLLVQCR